MNDDTEISGESAVGTGNDARVAQLNAIADQTDTARAEELAFVNDDDTTEPFTVETSGQPTEEEVADDTTSQTSEETTKETPAAEKRYKLRVNGRDLELSESELLARAQKIEAADEYLRQAAETKRRLEQMVQPPQDPNELQRRQDDEDLALVRAIQVGTEQEALGALRKLRSQVSASPSLSRDDVSRTIDERLSFNTAIDRFSTEYNDVWIDPVLKKLALDRDAQLIQEGDARPYWDRYSQIGEEIRAWKQSLVPAAKQETSLAEKEEKKASARKVPTSTSVKSKPARVEDDETDDSPSAVIAAMAQKRGGPQWMRG
jgi:hypothetical protein